jgi:hypothetical protein
MINLEIKGGDLVLHIGGAVSKAFALRGTLTVPLAHVKGARARPAEMNDFGYQLWGVGTGEWAHGYFYVPKRGMVFADHSQGDQVVAVDLDHERYSNLYIEVDGKSADQVVQMIEEAIKPAGAASR